MPLDDEKFSRVACAVAEAAAPGEVELAPFLARAYAEGARDLDRPTSGAVLGGFIGGFEAALFFDLLHCIASCATILTSVFAVRLHRLELKGAPSAALRKHSENDDELAKAVASVSQLLEKKGFSTQRAAVISRQAVAALVAQGDDGAAFVKRLVDRS